MAGHGYEPLPVQVASIQTLHGRAIRTAKIEVEPPDLIVVDECHHAPARTYQEILKAYPNAKVLGLTATPERGDGRGLGSIFEKMVECPQVQPLIDLGFLVPTRHYAPATPDLAGVATRLGDYVSGQLERRMDQPKLVGDIVTQWHRLGENRRTVVFASGVQHSIHIRDEFVESGVKAAHIDGSTPKDERDEILRQLGTGEITVVSNCMVLTEGWDMPDVGCAVLARPTKKLGLYRQMIGRVLRPAPDLQDAIIIDHSGAVFRHGFAEDNVGWSLSHDKLAENVTHASRKEVREFGDRSRLVECTQCGALRVGGEACRHCGFKPARLATFVATTDDDLALATRGGSRPISYTPEQRHEWHRMLAGIQALRGYSPKWARANYHEKFKCWPPHGAITPMSPSDEVLSWVRSRQIAFAKSKERAAA